MTPQGSDPREISPVRQEILIKLYAYALAMALLGILACGLFLVAGLQIGPDQLAVYVISEMWAAPLVLSVVFVVTLIVALPAYRYQGLLDKGHRMEGQEAIRFWRATRNFPIQAMCLSIATWVAGVSIMAWAMYTKGYIHPGLIASGSICCLLFGMSTSLGFFLKSRDITRKMFEHPLLSLPENFSIPGKFPIILKFFLAFAFIMAALSTGFAVQAWAWRSQGGVETALAAAHQLIEDMELKDKSGVAIEFNSEDHGVYVIEPYMIDIKGVVLGGDLTDGERRFILDNHRLLGRTAWEVARPFEAFLTRIFSRLVPLPEAALYNREEARDKPERWLVVDRSALSGGRHLGAVVQWKEMTSKQKQWRRISTYLLVIFLSATLLMGILYAYWLARDVSAPTGRLRELIERISHESTPSQSPIITDDEIGELASSFNIMSRTLKQKMEESRQIVSSVRKTINILAGILDRITAVSSDQAAGAAEQAVGLQQISSTSEEIAATLRTIAENARSVEDVAGRTLSSCQTGQKHLQDVISGMEGAITRSHDVGNKMLSFQEHSDKIENILEFIKEVSEKTNLIALNAAIEASSAGEFGDRFSIVATEMRKLAEQTVKGTKEISDIFGDLQSASASAIIATEEGQKQVALAQRLADQASEAFQSIVHWAGETARSAQEISLSSNQQTTATDHLASALGEINNVAAKFAGGAKDLEESIAELERIGDQLREMMKKGPGSREKGESGYDQ